MLSGRGVPVLQAAWIGTQGPTGKDHFDVPHGRLRDDTLPSVAVTDMNLRGTGLAQLPYDQEAVTSQLRVSERDKWTLRDILAAGPPSLRESDAAKRLLASFATTFVPPHAADST